MTISVEMQQSRSHIETQSPPATSTAASMPVVSMPVVLHPRVVTGTGGGPDKTIVNSPRFLRELGYRGVCAYMHPPRDPGFQALLRQAEHADTQLLSIPDRGAWDLSVVRRYVSICREHDVRIWHGHDYKSNAIGLLVRRFHPMKLVSTVHGWGVQSGRAPLYYRIDRACLRKYDKVICVSNDLVDQCLAAGVSPRNCVLIENAIDVDEYRPTTNRDSAKLQCGVDPHRLVIGTVGRLSVEKSFDELIRAVDDILSAGVEVSLLIAGDGPEREALRSLIDELGRRDAIRLLGHVADPRRLFEAMDVFVLNSLREGLPNALLESLAMQVPALVTAVGGIPRVIEHERNGLLTSPGNRDELTVSLSRLLHNPALRDQLARAGRKMIEADFSFDDRMRKIARVYDDVLDVPGRAVSIRSSQTANSEHVTARLTVEPAGDLNAWDTYLASKGAAGFHAGTEWLRVLEHGLQHEPVFVQATRNHRIVGVLGLAHVKSRLFGKFLVSLPYLNSSGVVADDDAIEIALVDRAIELADALDVRYLELRQERAIDHPQLTTAVTEKVHMRLELPEASDDLWSSLKSKVRSQIRKPLRDTDLKVHWGRLELLDEFYAVFCENMRDLGTPPFSRRLFASILEQFPQDSELCCVRLSGRPIASALLVHGPRTTEVPSASSLRRFNASNANMLMYWHLLARTIERGQDVFDFGRSTMNGGTFKFKKQWGAEAHPAVWQSYVRHGTARDMRPDNSKFGLMIKAWQKLPVWLTRWIGPGIVRGIP